MLSKNFKQVLSSMVSGSKVAKTIKESDSLKSEFFTYLDALNIVLQYEGKRSNIELIKANFETMKENEFIKFVSSNLPESRRVDGSSFLSSVKTIGSKKLD